MIDFNQKFNLLLVDMTKEEKKWIDSNRQPGSCPFDFKVFLDNDEVGRRRYLGKIFKLHCLLLTHHNL